MSENSTSRPSSKSQILHERLAGVIADTPQGGRLPTEPLLARQLGVSRATLREAMRTFEIQGLIHRRQGVGTFVIHPAHVIESGLEVLESIETMAERIGLQVKVKDFEMMNRTAEQEELEVMGLERGTQVMQVSRVIQAENRPVAYLVDILPDKALSESEVDESFTGSILDIMLKRGTPSLVHSRTEISAVPVSKNVARALGIQRADVVLCFKGLLFSVDGRVVDYSYSYFLPGYFRFHVVRRIDQV
jgi:GntR family transcriptional regulator